MGIRSCLISFVFIVIITGTGSQCEDKRTECPYWASVEECIITARYMMCSCAFSCNTPSFCNATTSNDTECKCRDYAKRDLCSDPSYYGLCQDTCELRSVTQCPAVQEVGNATVEPSKSDYFYLDTIKYACNEGFENVGNDPTVVCNEDGDWVVARNLPYPICKWIVCSSPPTIPNADMSGTTFDYNSTVTYSCHTGYEQISGNTERRCDQSKSWAGSNLVCERVTCPDPPSADNADVTFTSTKYEDVAEYQCITGYNASVTSLTKVCTEFRNWTGDDLECSVIDCGPIPVLLGTEVDNNHTTYDAIADYTCMQGYNHVTGDFTRTCAVDATWTGTDLQCEVQACGPPPSVNNANVSYENTTYKSEAQYTCVTGHDPVGGESVKECSESGAWIGEDLQCEAISCGAPADVTFAEWSAAFHIYQSQATYSCITGYEKTGGDDVKTCLETGIWDGDNLQCQIKDCGSPPVLSHSDVTSGPTVYQSEVEYTCHIGYEVVAGNTKKTCADTGIWTGNDLVCELVTCGAAPSVAHSSHVSNGSIYESRASYTCNTGYNQQGNDTVKTCTETGGWVGQDIVCIIVNCGLAPDLVNTRILLNYSTTYLSQVVFDCDLGYDVASGNDTLTCMEDGLWHGRRLRCKEKPSAAEIIGVIKKFEPEVAEAQGSVGFGVGAMIVMIVILVGILLLDLSTFYRDLKYMKENLEDFWEAHKPRRFMSKSEKVYGAESKEYSTDA